ncbi:MAG: hypothetical protein JW874_03440 [Spirochaetales bacterium]|nr:hypothetical protein [Spirochaetales bacterium]
MKRTRPLILILVLLLTFGMFGCISRPSFDWAPQKVAILPFMNQSADVEVPKFARAYLFETLSKRKKYEMMPLEEVDAALNDLGITDGGQLNTATVAELAAKLSADGIVYGEVITAKRVMLGVYFEKTFECHYMMYRGSDEAVMWDQTIKDSERKFVLNPNAILQEAGKAMIEAVATDVLLKAFKSHPLYKQIQNVTNRSVWFFPVL